MGVRAKPCKRCGGEKESGRGCRYCRKCSEESAQEVKVSRRIAERDPCIKCGGPKRAGHGQLFCDDCYEIAKWARDTKNAYLPRRPCMICKKRWAEKNCLKCEACRTVVRTCRDCDKPVRGPFKKLCEYHYAESLERGRKWKLEWERSRSPRPKKFKKKTRQMKVQYNETRRLQYRLLHDSIPVPLDVYRKGNGKIKGRGEESFAPEPFVYAIEDWMNGNTRNRKSLAQLANLPQRRIYGILNCETRVSLYTADKLSGALGIPLVELCNYQASEKQIDVKDDLCA